MTPRGDILTMAKLVTEGARDKTYGPVTENMARFADLLTGYIKAKGAHYTDLKMTPEDAAFVMVLAKMARCMDPERPYHADNYIDAAAYAAMAGECSCNMRE